MVRAMRAILDGESRLGVRAGVNRGHVFAGNIGTQYRSTYTVMGDTVNLAAREPARLAELRKILEKKYREVREESPLWPAWKFTGSEGRKIVWPDYVKKKPKK